MNFSSVGDSFVEDSSNTASYSENSKSNYASVSTVSLTDEDQHKDDASLRKFIDAKIGHLTLESKRPRRSLEAYTTSVNQRTANMVQQDEDCTAFCHRKIRMLSRKDRKADTNGHGWCTTDSILLPLENTRPFDRLKMACILQEMKINCKRYVRERALSRARSQRLEGTVLERHFCQKYVSTLQKDRLETRIDQELFKSSAELLAEVISGCPNPLLSGQDVWNKLLHDHH